MADGSTLVPPTDMQYLALQMLVRYLRKTNSIAEADFISQSGLSSNEISNFLNRDSKMRARTKHFHALRRPTQKFFVDKRLEVEPFLVLVHQEVEGAASDAGLQSVPETDLRSWCKVDGEASASVIDRLAGMWFVIRVSTTEFDDANEPEFNVSLLNIFPAAMMGEGLPQFRHYSRGKYNTAQQASFNGNLVIDADRIYLLGRDQDHEASLRMEFATFSYRKSEDHQPMTQIIGLMDAQASGGNPVSGHFLAEHIEGTSALGEDELDEKKKSCRQDIGVYTRKALEENKLVKDFDALDRLLKWSGDDLCFRERS